MLLKLPLCPYCKAIYRYDDVKKTTHEKTVECHNCKKKFSVSYIKGRVIILSVAAVLLVILNIIMMNIIDSITIWACLITTVIFISITVLLFPFTVRFKKIDGEESSLTKKNKNKKKSQKKQKKIEINLSDKFLG